MTVASTNTYEFTLERLLYSAYRYALLIAPGQEMTPEQRTEGSEALERLMRTMDIRATSARQVRYDVLTLTAGDEFVDLPADVIDVGHMAKYIAADEEDVEHAESETPVTRVFRDVLHEHGAKAAVGTPTQFRVDKSQVPYRLEVWPLPEEAGRVRVESHKLAADSRDTAATVDRERHFQECLVNGVAWVLAKSNGVQLDRVMMLKNDYESALGQCLGQEQDTVDRCFTIGHKGYRRV